MHLAQQSINARRMDLALGYAERAIPIFQEAGDEWGEAAARATLGGALMATGSYSESREMTLRALTVMKRLGDRRSTVDLLVQLAAQDVLTGSYAPAVERYLQILEEARDPAMASVRERVLMGLGNAYMMLGLYGEAERYADELGVCGSPPFVTTAWDLKRHIAIARGDIKAALNWQGKVLARSRQIGNINVLVGALIGQSDLLLMNEDLVRAREHVDEARQLARTVNDVSVKVALLLAEGTVLAGEGADELALSRLQEASELARRADNRADEGKALMRQGNLLLLRGRYREAEAKIGEAVAVREELSTRLGAEDAFKISLNDVRRTSYSALAVALAAQGKYAEVLAVSERSRARALSDLLQGRFDHDPTRAAHPVDLSEIRKYAVRERATIVEYLLIVRPSQLLQDWANFEELFILVVKPDGHIEFRRTPFQPDARATNERATFSSPASRRLVPAGWSAGLPTERQHKVLIEPIQDLLPADPKDTVIFIPDDFLFETPFAAIPNRRGEYLIERHTVMTAPSIQVLIQIRQRREARRRGPYAALVVGDPDGSLRFAAAEARAVARMLDGDLLLGPVATKARVLNATPACRIVHFAAHGTPDPISEGEMPGAIVLAPIAGKPSLLGANELMDLELTADLVTLSACSTARGHVNADGVIGLSRALLAAGSDTAIVALWDVPDDSTQMLMECFYQEYLRTNDKAGALRTAMQTTKKRSPNPVSWAAFSVIGERYSV